MKYFLIFLSFLVAIIIFVLFLLFTQSGNNIIKPYIKDAIQKELKQDVRIEAFTLKTNFVDVELILDKDSKIIVNGNFNIFTKAAELEYIVKVKDLQTPYVDIDGLLHVKGNVKGEMNNFQAVGTGVALNSKINFLTQIKDQKLKAIKLDAKNIKIENILSFLKKPIYSRGMIDLDVDIKPKENNNFFGKSNIIIHYGTLNTPLLEKDFGIKLDKTVTYRGTIRSTVYGKKIQAQTDIFSNVAKIHSKNTQYDLKEKVLYSDYIVSIPDLSAFEKNIQGNLTLDGNIQKTEEDFSFDVNSKALGGTIKAVVFNDTLKVNAKNIKLANLSTMLKQPQYSEGTLELSLDMQDTKPTSRDGRLVLHVNNGTLHVQELMQTKNQDKINYKLSVISDIKQDNAFINSQLESDVLHLDVSKSTYNLQSKTLQGLYNLSVADLNNLYFITNRPLKGELLVNGNYKKDQQLYLDGNSSFLDAQTTFTLENNLLHVKSDELSTTKTTDMLYYPKVFDSFASLEADYNLTSEVGVVSLNALNGKLIKNELTDIIQLASGFDLTNEIYKDSLFRGVIDKNKVDFSLLMNGLESYFKIPDGYLNLETNEIDSQFDIKIQNKDFKGTIKGNLDKPSVELSGSEYIKQKLDKAIEKNVPEEWQDTAKELLKLFG